MSTPLINQLGVVKRGITRADPAAVARLAKLGVATIHEAMGRVGLMKPYMRPVYAGARSCDLTPSPGATDLSPERARRPDMPPCLPAWGPFSRRPCRRSRASTASL